MIGRSAGGSGRRLGYACLLHCAASLMEHHGAGIG
jgi:hypothetical protein